MPSSKLVAASGGKKVVRLETDNLASLMQHFDSIRNSVLILQDQSGKQIVKVNEVSAPFKEMGTLRCDSCGEEFIVSHDPTFVDGAAAEPPAHWLDRVLAEEHERERKHPDRIELPD
jgi:hypothetical protein